MTDTVTITKKRYNSFLNDRAWRRALEAGGVDNWDYYYIALHDAGFFDEDYGSPSDE